MQKLGVGDRNPQRGSGELPVGGVGAKPQKANYTIRFMLLIYNNSVETVNDNRYDIYCLRTTRSLPPLPRLHSELIGYTPTPVAALMQIVTCSLILSHYRQLLII